MRSHRNNSIQTGWVCVLGAHHQTMFWLTRFCLLMPILNASVHMHHCRPRSKGFWSWWLGRQWQHRHRLPLLNSIGDWPLGCPAQQTLEVRRVCVNSSRIRGHSKVMSWGARRNVWLNSCEWYFLMAWLYKSQGMVSESEKTSLLKQVSENYS
jgi:hypothetical protein